MDAHRCLSCGKHITWQFAICSACEGVYGRTSREWPEWLAFMWRDTVKDRRRDKQIKRWEISTADMPFSRQVVYYDEYAEEQPV